MRSIKGKLLMIVVVLSLGGVVYSLSSIFSNFNVYHQSAKGYEEVQKIYEDEVQQNSHAESMLNINKDYVGWIQVKDTNINYPVVQTEDNSYYLTHNFQRKKDFVGSIFMDYKNSGDKLDQNTILYGHNMKDASMFGSLKKYLDHGFYQTHKTISFDYLGRTYEWEIFSVYTSDDTEWMKTQFSSSGNFEEYLAAIKQRTVISTQTEVNNENRILTLSTCTNRDEDERIIVHAKLMTKGNDLANED